MPLRTIDHVQLAMPPGEEAAARAFYSGVLGLDEIAKPGSLAGRGGCWFEQGGVRLHLGVETDFRPARKAHPGILVEDLPALLERCRAAGVEVVADDKLADRRRAFVHDPFGNRLEFLGLHPAP